MGKETELSTGLNMGYRLCDRVKTINLSTFGGGFNPGPSQRVILNKAKDLETTEIFRFAQMDWAVLETMPSIRAATGDQVLSESELSSII